MICSHRIQYPCIIFQVTFYDMATLFSVYIGLIGQVILSYGRSAFRILVLLVRLPQQYVHIKFSILVLFSR